VCFGGGGIRAGELNLLVQVACLFALAVVRRETATFVEEAPRGLLVLVVLTLALPALQLIPVPPAIWHNLPGRDTVVRSLELVDSRNAWMPVSLDPNRTAIALVAIASCLPVLILSFWVGRRNTDLVPVTLVGLGLLSALLGALQLSLGNQRLVIQPRGVMRHQLYATFANHNASGLFFVLCLVSLTAVRAGWLADRLRAFCPAQREGHAVSRAEGAIKVALGALFVLCTILSQSRSALIILALVLVWMSLRRARALARFARRPWAGRAGLPGSAAVAVLVVGAVAGLTVFVASHSVQESLSRFEETDDPRFRIWEDVNSVIARYMPVGAGVGSFDDVFQLDESLESVSPLRVGRAHSDYLEAAVESGVVGPVLILAWVTWIASCTWTERGRGTRPTIVAASGVMVCIGLQSTIDYPLRNMAMLAIAASMIGLLARPVEQVQRSGAAGRSESDV
jgi:O-antigen ligase